MKIFLFSITGQVGWELQRSLAPLGHLTALDVDSNVHCGDFTNLQGLADTVRAVRPDVVINATVHTAANKAESELEFARNLDVLAPDVLAQEATKLGAWLVHYSTDYAFDGSGTRPWIETDTPAPLSVYGQTKPEASSWVRSIAPSTGFCAPVGSTRRAVATSPSPCCAWRKSVTV